MGLVAREVRRIVTGVDAAGRSAVVSDAVLAVPAGLWLTSAAPASTTAPDPLPAGALPPVPHRGSGGSALLVADISPGAPPIADVGAMRRAGLVVSADRLARHPHFHATATLDYCVCLEGEVTCLLDDGDAVLRAGDVLIQRGTQHAWVNRSEHAARMLFVLLDADPPVPLA